MVTRLTSSGITFNDSTSQSTQGVEFASGTLMLFQQSSAPVGWTKQTTHNDKVLRVVSGTAGSGGGLSFSSFTGQSIGSTTLDTNTMPAHVHEGPIITSANDSFYGRGRSRFGIFGQDNGTNTVALQETVGGGGSHTHSLNMSLQYVDLIIASKN